MLDRITYMSKKEGSYFMHLTNETDLVKDIGVELVLNKIHNVYVPVKRCPSSFILKTLYEPNIDKLYLEIKEMSNSDILNLIRSKYSIDKFKL